MRRLLALLSALALCLSLSACWEAEVPEEDFWELEAAEPAPKVESAPKPARFTLPYLNSQAMDPVTCSDGVQQLVGSLLYEGLFFLDGQFEPQPLLCSSYSRSSNGLTYTFTLRNAAFSSGAALTPADVLATYRRAQMSERYSARFANVASMRAGRSTVTINLRQANSAFPALLDIPIVKSGTEKENVPLGTGPYLFLTDADGPCLMRNDNWWNDAAVPLERISLAPAKDTDSAVYLFSAKNAHLLTADLLNDSSAASLGGVDVTDVATPTLLFLGFNVRHRPLDDPTLRRTMSIAFDRSVIAETLLTNHAAAAQFPIHPTSPLYPAELEQVFETNAYEAALRAPYETAEADKAPSEPAPAELRLLVNEENSTKAALAEYLARQLTAAHITVTSVALPWADYIAALERGDFDLWMGEIRLTADWNITDLVGSHGLLNYGGYANPAMDAALSAFLANETSETSSALCSLLAEDAPLLPLAFKSLSVLTPTGTVSGLSSTMTHPLRNLSGWRFHLPDD